jgi:hypothetical protein
MAIHTLQIWSGVARDLLLLNLGSQDLLQHEVLKEELLGIKDQHSQGECIKILKLINLSKEYLTANVSPKNVLENLVINI